MRHYTFTDQLYRSDIKTVMVAANESPQVIELNPPSKTLLIRNDGGVPVFLSFDAPEGNVSSDDFKLLAGDGLVELKIQAKHIGVVCNPTEAATVRISSNY